MVNVIVEGAKRLLPHAAQTALPYMLPLGQVSGITVSVSDHVQLQSIVQVAYVMRPFPSPTSPTWGTSLTQNNLRIELGHHRACL